MAGLLYAGFDYGRSSDLPGPQWATADFVEILPPPAGRFGGGCAFLSAALGSQLTANLTWGDTTAVIGFAIKPISVFAEPSVTLAQLVTTDSTIKILATPSGALSVTQDGVECCSAGPGLLDLDAGTYIELRVTLAAGSPQIELRAGSAIPLTVATGDLDTLAIGEAFDLFVLGGGAGEVGDFYLDDVYCLDGVTVNPISIGSRVIDNASFLGNIVVQAVYATGDAYNLDADAGYTPWTPATGTTHFNQINENPPDDGATNESADASQIGTYAAGMMDKYDSFQFQHPRQGVDGFGLMPGGVTAWPLFAVQLIYAFLVDAAHDVDATVRVVDDLPSTDSVFIGDVLTPTLASYRYFNQIFDRDPSL